MIKFILAFFIVSANAADQGDIYSYDAGYWRAKSKAELDIADSSHDHSGTYEPANANIQAHITNTANPHSVTATQVGLGNVDNTSDANKPISTATQTALDGKVDDSQVLTNVPAGAVFTDTQLNEAQVDTFVSNNGFLTSEVDGSTTNELVTSFVRTGTEIRLTDAGGITAVELMPILYPNITLALNGNNLELTDPAGTLTADLSSLGGGGGEATTVSDTAEIDLTLTGSDITADIVASSIDEAKLDASVNASLDLADTALQSFTEVDGSTTNEIQELDLTGNNLTITSGTNTIDLSGYLDDTTLDETAVDAFVANNGYLTADETTVGDTAEIDLTLTGVNVTGAIVASSIDETKLDASVNASLDLADSALQSFTETNDLSSSVTWANVPDANITQSSVTQHQAALTITESQISDLDHSVDVVSNVAQDVILGRTSLGSGDSEELDATAVRNFLLVEPNAAADQSDAEIVTQFTNEVPQVTEVEKTAGAELAIRQFSPDDVKDMIDTHAGSGGGGGDFQSDGSVSMTDGINFAAGTTTASIDFLGVNGAGRDLTIQAQKSDVLAGASGDLILRGGEGDSVAGTAGDVIIETVGGAFSGAGVVGGGTVRIRGANFANTGGSVTIDAGTGDFTAGTVSINGITYPAAGSAATIGHVVTVTAAGVLGIQAAAGGGSESTTVSDTAEIDLTLTGSDITADIVASSIDETKLDASVNASLNLADTALQSFTEVDGSTTNEIQDLDLTGNNLTITSGTNTIDLSGYLDDTVLDEATVDGYANNNGYLTSDQTTVSDTAEIDLTLTGDDITADIVASSIDETKLDASVNASLDLADSAIQTQYAPPFTFCIPDPATADTSLFGHYLPQAITVTSMRSFQVGGTSVTVNIGHATTRTGTQNDLFTSDVIITSTADQNNNSGFNDATFPAGSWVWPEIVAVSGAVTSFCSTIIYTID